MGNLKGTLTTKSAIEKAYVDNDTDGFRPHLGASIIGRKCEKELLFNFRWSKQIEFEGRMLRLFETGHMAEARFVQNLQMIGCKVEETDENGEQWRFEAFGGHFGGSSDGVITEGVIEAPKSPHIGEMKTHNDKSFKKLVKQKVELAKPEHFIQMNTYMGMTGDRWGAKYRIERALYIAVNKNDDDLYTERTKFDKKLYDQTMMKAERIIFTTKSLAGISTSPSWFECKFCDYSDLCYKKKLPEVNCRTCAYSTPEQDGSWLCEKKNTELDMIAQNMGCDEHLFNPMLVDTWLTPIDGTNDSIVFEDKKNGKTWINGKDNISSKEAFKVLELSFMI